ncbi:hypothetical protein [Massilia sp.]|uniref:pilus assembly PilX family protein n=1 Tax=Massilia sp. TaxID=1882437 RepID=UPI00289AD2E5|nr:hypothetical protein [Massilia sp.]
MNMHRMNFHRQAGLALPVMLIILLVMLISSIYLLKSSNSTTLTASNLAYDSAQSRAVDFGLHAGFKWLSETAGGNKALLNEDVPDQGYLATHDPRQGVRSDAFWNGKRTVTHEGQQIEYVVHRHCLLTGPYDGNGNACVQTADNGSSGGTIVSPGDSLAADSPQFASTPKVHYVVTARLSGARGGNVVNQLVVLIGG